MKPFEAITGSSVSTCLCPACDKTFDCYTARVGERALCPQCGAEITIELKPEIPVDIPPPIELPERKSEPEVQYRSCKFGHGMSAVLLCVSVLIMLDGCSTTSETVMQQIAARIQWCSGLIIFSVAVLIEVAAQIVECFRK